jgi:hypothetical protein
MRQISLSEETANAVTYSGRGCRIIVCVIGLYSKHIQSGAYSTVQIAGCVL